MIETHDTHQAALDALAAIKIIAKPGQELTIYEAIDLICNVYNIARDALIEEIPQ